MPRTRRLTPGRASAPAAPRSRLTGPALVALGAAVGAVGIMAAMSLVSQGGLRSVAECNSVVVAALAEPDAPILTADAACRALAESARGELRDIRGRVGELEAELAEHGIPVPSPGPPGRAPGPGPAGPPGRRGPAGPAGSAGVPGRSPTRGTPRPPSRPPSPTPSATPTRCVVVVPVCVPLRGSLGAWVTG